MPDIAEYLKTAQFSAYAWESAVTSGEVVMVEKVQIRVGDHLVGIIPKMFLYKPSLELSVELKDDGSVEQTRTLNEF